MPEEVLRIVDIPSETLEETGKRISDYTIGFARLAEIGEPDAALGGSGTLVRIDQYHAILTAAHVVDSLWKSDLFGVILSGSPLGRPHNLLFEKSRVREIRVPRPEGLDKSEPPDIALLVVPTSRVGDIAAYKSFYDLRKHRNDAFLKPPDWGMGFWSLAGFAHEWTVARSPSYGFKRFVEFNGKVLGGFATPIDTESDFDAWTFPVSRDLDYDGPISFEGYSGGGLWHNLIEKTNTGRIRLTKSLLSGVAYYQSGFQSDKNTVRCNGRRCIYEHVINAFKT